MSVVVCPVLPFPNIYWWSCVVSSSDILLDKTEHFEKMSFRNRYLVAGADGVITLSIPVADGRQQRKPMNEVRIDNKTNWQIQHWRTLVSVYNRSPYFEFYRTDLESLFLKKFEFLCDFNQESINVLTGLLRLKLNFQSTDSFIKHYPETVIDIRTAFRSNQYNLQPQLFKSYHQTFEERTGFFPNLSMLDLLFAEGRNALSFLPNQQS